MKISIEKTKEYYVTLDVSSLCDCGYCINYRKQIKSRYPVLTSYLAALGVDIEKPYEASPLEAGNDGTMSYCCCQYIVFGECGNEFSDCIEGAEIRKASSYPGTGITEEHFVLEFGPVYLSRDAI